MAVAFRSIDLLEVGPFAQSPQVLIQHSSSISPTTNVHVHNDEVVEDSLKDDLALVRARRRSNQGLELVSGSRLGTTITNAEQSPAARADSISPPKNAPCALPNAEQIFARHQENSIDARSTNKMKAADSKKSKSCDDRSNGQENQPVSSTEKSGKLPRGSVSAALRARKERSSALQSSIPAEPLAQRSTNVTTTKTTPVEHDEFDLEDELAEQASLKKPKNLGSSKPPARNAATSSKSGTNKSVATANSGKRLSNKDTSPLNPNATAKKDPANRKKRPAKPKKTNKAASASGTSAVQAHSRKRKSDAALSLQSPSSADGSVYHEPGGERSPPDESRRRSDRVKRCNTEENEEAQFNGFSDESRGTNTKRGSDKAHAPSIVSGQKSDTEEIDNTNGDQSHENKTDAQSNQIFPQTTDITVDHYDHQNTSLVPPAESAEKQKVLGKSQETAIMVDDMDTSSDIDSNPSPVPNHNAERDYIAPRPEAVAETERVGSPPSSPPQIQSMPRASSKTPASADRARKTTIIGFDKFGPRNQGALPSSVKHSRGGRSSSPLKSEVVTMKKNDGKLTSDNEHGHLRNGLAQPHTNLTSHKRGSSSLGNVADTVGDALNSLLAIKRPVSADPVSEPPSKRHKENESLPSIDPKMNADVTSDVEAFLQNDDSNIDEEAVMPRSPVADHNPASKPVTSDRTKSQIIMPPPSRQPPRREQQESSQPHTILLQNMSKANVATFAPPEVPVETVCQLAKKKQPDTSDSSSMPVSNALSALALKSSLAKSPTVGFSNTRDRLDESFTSDGLDFGRLLHTNLRTASQDNLVARPNAHLELMPLHIVLEQAPRDYEAKEAVQPRSDPRVVRRRSSRTVDSGGSPVPQDMELAENTTVLEAYMLNEKSPNPQEFGSSERERILEPRPRTSELHPRPYLQEVSPKRSSINLGGRQKFIHDDDVGTWSELRDHKLYSMLKEKTKKHHDLTNLRPAQPSQTGFVSELTRPMDDKINQLQSHINLSKAGASTKKHPVNPTAVDKHKAATVDVLATGARLASTGKLATAGESAREAPMNRAHEKYDHDLTIWRSALRPHQLILHDELINIAHRLTQHLVDDEVTLARSVDDYRRRSLTIIEKMEAQRCELYRRLEESLERKREAVKGELRVFERVLQGCKHGVEEMRTEIDRKRMYGKEMDRDIEMLIERWG